MDRVFNMIKSSGKCSFKSIKNRIDIDESELVNILNKLKLEGKILQQGDKYILFPKDLFLGTVIVSLTGRYYVLYNDTKIMIDGNSIDKIRLNDTVSFKINDKNEAEIVTIVDRKLDTTTCEVVIINGKKWLIPFGKNDYFSFSRKIMDTLYEGDIILVKKNNHEFDYDNYEFIKKVGRRDDPTCEELATAIEYGFDNEYNDKYMKEVNALPTDVSKEETIGRADFRRQKAVTIDGANTKDMDDSLFAELLENGNIRLYVHIADVSHYVKIGSEIFKRACEKTTSLYLNNTVFHMLHPILAKGICSLNPNVDRLTKTVIMDIDKDGKIVNYEIKKSVINSKMKMVYEDVDKLLKGDKSTPKEYYEFKKELFTLYDVAARLEKRFVGTNGKLTFANDKDNISYNSDGSIKNITNVDDSISRKIVENTMIAANMCVAEFVFKRGFPMIFRVHEFPDLKVLNDAITALRKQGYNVRPIRDNTPQALQKVLNVLSKYKGFNVLSQMIVMTLKRARYSVENLGHYALGLLFYCHFTSPIRRLADLLVHMILDLILKDYHKIDEETIAMYEELFKQLAYDASRMERQADAAERFARRKSILKKLEKNKDEIYEASVVELGSRIKLIIDGVLTSIKARDLDQVFAYNRRKKFYYDRDTMERIKIGTKLSVKLTNVSSIGDMFNVKVIGLAPSEKEEIVETLRKAQNIEIEGTFRQIVYGLS